MITAMCMEQVVSFFKMLTTVSVKTSVTIPVSGLKLGTQTVRTRSASAKLCIATFRHLLRKRSTK
jgi:hypothetical protein